MSLLDIFVAKPSFQSHCRYTRSQFCINDKATNYYLLQVEERWTSLWKFSPNPKKMNIHMSCHKKLHPEFLDKAVATCEPKNLVQSEDGGKENNALLYVNELKSATVHFESSDADSKEIDAKEKLRRMRISKANKGLTPWNKGRKHGPETLQRIRERTKLAMQNPKVRMKLGIFGRPQSQETRDKIRKANRMNCKKRRQRQKMQESCLFDWQNLIAEAAKRGFNGEEELQWNSYEILDKQLQEEWLDMIEYRKPMPRPKINTAPKSLEHRRKISEAIAAKWADPEYRARFWSGMAKYRRTPEGAKRRVKKKPSGEEQSRKTPKEKVRKVEKKPSGEAWSRQPKVKKGVLTAEAEKTAKALEVVAMRSCVAQGSLIEARKLIAEATRATGKLDNGEIGSLNDAAPPYHQNHVVNMS